jgi:RNA-directed DNA polymerase
MEEALGIKWRFKRTRETFERISKRAIVKYADDFVVFCESEEDARECKRILTEWLATRGLELSAEKTRIVSLEEGFDFLGFNVRRYKVHDRKSGYKTLIKPSKGSIQKLKNKLKAEWKKLIGRNAIAVIKELNPIIRGWANYFRHGVSAETFENLDNWMFRKTWGWVRRTHPKKSKTWRAKRYYGAHVKGSQYKWRFGSCGFVLNRFSDFHIDRHIMVKGTYSPDDQKLEAYWETRRSKALKGFTKMLKTLAYRQEGKCLICKESLLNDEELHVHHIVPRKDGGEDKIKNLALVHLFCHQQIHSSNRGDS